MNGSKEERGGYGLCCGHSMRSVYLGLVLFVIGLIMLGTYSIPEIIMIVGALTIITGLISMFFHKEK